MSRLQWGGSDAFTHTIIVGPTRCGKTATIIKPLIYQILTAKAKGFQCGLSVIEPKGDVAQFTVDLARELGIKAYHLDPERDDSDMINLLKGPVDDVAEATIAVLKGMFGKQEAFFQLVQELTARNFIKLLKLNHGDNLDILSVLRALRDDDILKRETKLLEKSGKDPDLFSFFEHEMRGRLGDKWKDLALGLRAQIENIVSNERLKRIITGDSGIDLDRHMAEGGVLAVNTDLGRLRRSGDAFGQFMAMHIQSAAFRRPGTERTRIPHYLIIDEYSRYINPDTEKFLSIAAEYRVAALLAVQSFSQLEIESGDLNARAMKTAILTNCRNKICFGGISADDAEYFAREIGKDWNVRRENTFDGLLLADFLPKTYRDTEKEEYRIRPTDIQDGLPKFYYVHRLVKDGQPMRPGIAKGEFVPADWRERVHAVLEEKKTAPERGLFSLLKKRRKGGEQPSSGQPETNDRLIPTASPKEAEYEQETLQEPPTEEVLKETLKEEAPKGNEPVTRERVPQPSRLRSPKIIVNQKIQNKEQEELKKLNESFI